MTQIQNLAHAVFGTFLNFHHRWRYRIRFTYIWNRAYHFRFCFLPVYRKIKKCDIFNFRQIGIDIENLLLSHKPWKLKSLFYLGSFVPYLFDDCLHFVIIFCDVLNGPFETSIYQNLSQLVSSILMVHRTGYVRLSFLASARGRFNRPCVFFPNFDIDILSWIFFSSDCLLRKRLLHDNRLYLWCFSHFYGTLFWI